VRLVACGNCHTQYDVTDVVDREITCRCGAKVENCSHEGKDTKVRRCGSCGAQTGADMESCDYCGSEIVRDIGKLSLICPECFGRNEEASRFCTSCGIAFQPHQVQQGGEELPCPSCDRLMPVRSIGGVGINECPGCNGIWVPENRFDHLIAKACEAARGDGASLRTEARVSGGNPAKLRVVYRNCPVCDAHMMRRNFRKKSGVIIDRCHDHGTWLDADELERIAGFITEGGMPDGAREYALKKEIDAVRRREAAAYGRAARGESITIDLQREKGAGATLLGILNSLLR